MVYPVSEALIEALGHIEVDLNEAIIPLDIVPAVEVPEGQEPIRATVIGPAELSYEGRSIDVNTQLLAFNALLLYRDSPVASGELKDLGFALHRATFRQHLMAISEKLADLTGEQLIEERGYGKGMTYRLSPRLQLIEGRADEKSSLARRLQRLISYHPSSLEEFDGTNPVVFKSSNARNTGFGMIIRDYSALPEVQRKLHKTFTHTGRAMRERGFFESIETPSDEQCAELFYQIEKGIAAAVLGEQTYASVEAVMDMIIAYQKLYFGHMFMVGAIASDFTKDSQRYKDLSEIGSVQLVKAIIAYRDREEGPEGTFASAAYTWIKSGVLHYRSRELPMLHIPGHIIERRREVVRAIDTYITEHQRMPGREALAAELSLTAGQVQDALSLPLTLRDLSGMEELISDDPDSFDKELNARLAAVEIQSLFLNLPFPDCKPEDFLDAREKIVLSLRYGVFSPALAGAEFVAKGRTTFTYPHSVEDLPPIDPTFEGLTKVFGVTKMAIHNIEKRALAKSRRILTARGVRGLGIFED